MSAKLPPDILTARLKVVLAFSRGEEAGRVLASWLSIEPVDDNGMGAKLLEAVAQVIGYDRAMSLVLFASSSFRLELAEVVDGRR
jgi:hypothetical protein